MRTPIISIIYLFFCTIEAFGAAPDIDFCLQTMRQHIANFDVVVPGKVYRGARPKTALAISKMNEACQIRKIINLQGADPKLFWFWEPGEDPRIIATEFSWVHSIPGMDAINYPLSAWYSVDAREEALIEQTVSDLAIAATSPDGQPTYVHCEHGKDRTGLVIALFQVFYNNMSPADAHQQMRDLGHSSFMPEMDEYFNLATAAPMSLSKIRQH